MFNQVIKSLEEVRDEIDSRNSEMALETITAVLLQLTDLFGHDKKLMGRYSSILEQLRGEIQKEKFDEAWATVVGLLATFRKAQSIGNPFIRG